MSLNKIRNNTEWKNVPGSSKVSQSPVGYSSWIEYYRDKTGCVGDKCCNDNCSNKGKEYIYFLQHKHELEIVGAHVYQPESGDKTQYIVPLCESCNSAGGDVAIKSGTVAVSANQSAKTEVIVIL